ncbi:MAG: hypothetical protein KBS52_06795 [Clostridiales bacterium]|nr:hypothetical protein [Candidatus Equinaster intestinalis]
MDIFKIVFVLLFTCIAAVILSQYKKEYSVAVAVAGGCTVIFFTVKNICAPVAEVIGILKDFGIKNEYISVALKALVIGYVTKFAADTCKDSGQTSLASKAELAGKAAIFIITLPVLISTFNTIFGLIK